MQRRYTTVPSAPCTGLQTGREWVPGRAAPIVKPCRAGQGIAAARRRRGAAGRARDQGPFWVRGGEVGAARTSPPPPLLQGLHLVHLLKRAQALCRVARKKGNKGQHATAQWRAAGSALRMATAGRGPSRRRSASHANTHHCTVVLQLGDARTQPLLLRNALRQRLVLLLRQAGQGRAGSRRKASGWAGGGPGPGWRLGPGGGWAGPGRACPPCRTCQRKLGSLHQPGAGGAPGRAASHAAPAPRPTAACRWPGGEGPRVGAGSGGPREGLQARVR